MLGQGRARGRRRRGGAGWRVRAGGAEPAPGQPVTTQVKPWENRDPAELATVTCTPAVSGLPGVPVTSPVDGSIDRPRGRPVALNVSTSPGRADTPIWYRTAWPAAVVTRPGLAMNGGSLGPRACVEPVA